MSIHPVERRFKSRSLISPEHQLLGGGHAVAHHHHWTTSDDAADPAQPTGINGQPGCSAFRRAARVAGPSTPSGLSWCAV